MAPEGSIDANVLDGFKRFLESGSHLEVSVVHMEPDVTELSKRHEIYMLFQPSEGESSQYQLGVMRSDEKGGLIASADVSDVLQEGFVILHQANEHGLSYTFRKDESGIFVPVLTGLGFPLPVRNDDAGFDASVLRMASDFQSYSSLSHNSQGRSLE